jgi:hypothetical protein
MNKQRALNLYHAMKKAKFNHQQIVSVCEKIKIQHNIDVFSLLNRGKPQNRYNINNYATGSGGRSMAQYKSGHVV